MKEKIKTFFCVLILLGALPYIITIVLQGKEGVEKETSFLPAENQAEEKTDIEESLVGIVAKEMPITYETEALKAQAVIARTNLMAALEKGEEPPKAISREELMKLWGADDSGRNYRRLSDAVKATEGVVLIYQGDYIYAAFHAVSAGKTRSAAEALKNDEMPWLAGVDSREDISSEDYLKVVFLVKEEFGKRLNAAFPEAAPEKDDPLGSITIDARDGGDYVIQMKIGEKTISGEEFRNALELNSACFYLKEVEGRVRVVTKGLGHGLGMSQYGANALAGQGAAYSEILGCYFKNVTIQKEKIQ